MRVTRFQMRAALLAPALVGAAVLLNAVAPGVSFAAGPSIAPPPPSAYIPACQPTCAPGLSSPTAPTTVIAPPATNPVLATPPTTTANAQGIYGLGSVLNNPALLQMQAVDAQQAQIIAAQIAATAQQQTQRWQIVQSTQTAIFQIQQDVTVNKAQTQDKVIIAWDQYIR